MIRILSPLACLVLSALPLAAQPAPGLADARILPGWTLSDGSRMAAIEFQLEPGWKTYWRNPGDSGLPPVFDWSGSSNLGQITLHWPAPEAISSGGDMTLGYRDRLVLPFTARPAYPARPVGLAVDVDFGLCQEICVPGRVSLRAAAAGDAPDPAILEAMDRVPRPDPLRPVCEIRPIADGMRVTATLPDPVALAAIELPGSDVWVSATQIDSGPDRTVISADLIPPDAAPFDLPRDRLVFTALGENGAVEMRGCAG